MSDDVDDLLRRAMATLDRQLPPGYFDALPGRTLARLEEPASPRTGVRGRTAAIAGVVLAAAAGVVLFWTVRDRDRADVAAPSNEGAITRAESPTAVPARAPAAPADPGAGGDRARGPAEAPAGSAAATPSAVTEPDVPQKSAVPTTKRSGKRPPSKAAALPEPPVGKLEGQGEKTEAQVQKRGKPSSGPARLSADAIQRAMAAIAAQVRACYAGTRGVASLQVTVAPSGLVAKVTVTGPFAGTPVGTCVERAVAAAAFPPRGGGPQSFDYSYLLSDQLEH